MIRRVAFSPDGRRLAHSTGTLELDGIAQRYVVLHKWGALPLGRGPLGVTYSPDGRWLASASDDGTVRVWRITGDGEPVVYRSHGTSVHSG